MAIKNGDWLLYQRQGICVGLTSIASCCLCETECGIGFNLCHVTLFSKSLKWLVWLLLLKDSWKCKLFHEFHCFMEGWKWYLAFACDWLCNCFDFGFLAVKWNLLWLNNNYTHPSGDQLPCDAILIQSHAMSVEFLSPARSKSKLNTFNTSANLGKSSWIFRLSLFT